jgi:glycosyltransferase involved in cell wall biosynthesis
MKHLYLFDETESNAALFGVGTYMKNLIFALKDTNIKITVFKLISNKEEVFIEKSNGVRHIYIPKPIEKSGKKNYYRNVFFVIYPYIKRDTDAVFHLNYLGCHNLAKSLKEHLPVKIVLTIHYRELHTSENIKREKDLIDKYCDKVIVLAEHSRLSLMRDYQIKPDKIAIIPNGIIDCFSDNNTEYKRKMRKMIDIREDEIVLLYAGRLDANKNPSVLIKSFQNLISEYSNIRLFIAGSGDYNMIFKDMTHSWGKISLTGFLGEQDLYDLYSIADIGIIPSIYEEFGYAAIEMMMHQVPVIVNKSSGLAEIIEDGKSGLMVASNNCKTKKDSIDKFMNAIRILLNNQDLREKIGKNGRIRFKDKYTIERFTENMLIFYNKLFESDK